MTMLDTAVRYRAPDGSLITIAAPGYDLTAHWSADVLVRLKRPYAGVPEGRQLRDFHVAPIRNYDSVLARVINGRWVYQADAQGGQFLVGHSDTAEQGLAIWRGRWHEVATWLDEPRMAGSRALQYFERLQFADEPDGLRISSQTQWSEQVETRSVSAYIPGVGPVLIRAAQPSDQQVPEWSGATPGVGEVWQERTSEPGAPTQISLLHATRTTVATLTGAGRDKGDVAARLEFLQALTELSWTREAS